MRGWSLPAASLTVLVLAGIAHGDLPFLTPDPPPASPTPGAVSISLEVVAFACSFGEGVCLGYNGITPGPTIITHAGDELRVIVTNHIAETVAGLSASPALKERLAAASISYHQHGTSLAADQDGVMAVPGTNLIDSMIMPGETRTYVARTIFVGPWHYHDHVLGPDGAEGQQRGLYGSLLVLPSDESTTPLDLHLLDAGPNGGRGLNVIVAAGERFDVLVAGLGNYHWTVQLFDPNNVKLAEVNVGPGTSEDLFVLDAQLGTYTWKATTVFLVQTFSGSVTAQ